MCVSSLFVRHRGGFHDPLLNNLWEQQVFFVKKQEKQQKGEVLFDCLHRVPTVSDSRLGTPWTVIHLRTETTLLVASPAYRQPLPKKAP